jgi:sec-independent protein translocase protein TatC
MADKKLPLTAHLEELRKRIKITLIAVVIGFGISYFFSKELFDILMIPLVEALPPDSTLIFTGVAEAFITYLKVALVCGIFLASPVILHQLWAFLAPGLYENEKKSFFPVILFSSFFFVGGALFGYFVIFPFGFQYFLGFATDIIKPMPSVREYFAFSVKLLFAFGVVFELPLFILFLSRLGIVNHKMLRSFRKYALLLIFAVAAIITPPDVFSQIMLGLPMILLYEVGIIVAKLFGKEKREAHNEATEDMETANE